MRKYYVCDVIGDGTELNPYRAKISDLAVNHVSVMNAAKTWAMCRVAGINLELLDMTPGIDAMPDFPLDSKMTSMGNAAKNNMNAKLNARSITQPTSPDAYREVIRHVGQQANANFNEDNFDVSE